MRKKTLFLDQGETLGGAERFLLDFFNVLSNSEITRIEPVVIGAKLKKYQNRLSEKIKIIDFDFPSVKGSVFKKIKAIFQIYQSAKILTKIAKNEEATTIFSNTPRTHFVMLLAKKLCFIHGEWIVMIHDFTTPGFLMKQITKNADILIANSMPTREYIRQFSTEKNSSKIKIIENGIDFGHIPPANPPRKIKKILILGRIEPRKGQMHVILVADMLKDKYPDLEFTIVGDVFLADPKTVEYKQKICNFIEEKALKNVRMLPEVENPFEEIAKHDCILVLPTVPETFGRIAIEGLAMGKLVIAFDETGPREIFRNYEKYLGRNKTFLLVKKEDTEGLAEKISYFVENPDKLAEFTIPASTFVEKQFSLKETKKRLINVILNK